MTLPPPATTDAATPAVLARRLAILDRIATTTSEAVDLASVMERAITVALDVTSVEGGGVFLIDEASGDLFLAAHRGVGPAMVASFLADPGPLLRRVAQNPNGDVVVESLAQISEPRPQLAAEAYRTFAVVPLRARGQTLGLLAVLSRTPTGLLDADVELLVSVGRLVGAAIERARLYELERRRARLMETISELGRQIGAMRGERELAAYAIARIKEGLGYESASLYLREGAELTVAAAAGLGREATVGERFAIDGERSFVGWVAEHDDVLLANDIRADAPAGPPERAAARLAELATPVRAGGELLGVLDVQSARPDGFHEIDISAFQALADQIGVAIENARLHERARRSLQRAQALQEVTAAITSSLDLRGTLERVLDAAMAVFAAQRAAVFFPADPEVVHLRRGAARNFSERFISAVEEHANTQRAVSMIPRRVRSYAIADVQTATLVPALAEAVRAEGFRGLLALALRKGEQLLGVMAICHDDPHAYSAEEQELALTFADQSAIAIENARLYEESQQSLRRRRGFQRVATALASSLDLQSTLEHTLDAAMDVFGADRAAVYFFADEAQRRVRRAASRNLSETFIAWVERTLDVQRLRYDLSVTRTVYVADVQALPGFRAMVEAARAEGFHSTLVLGLRKGDTVIGLMVLYHDSVRPYTEEETTLAHAFGDQAAAAIANARQYEDTQRALQRTHALQEVTSAVSRSLDLRSTLARSLDVAMAQFGADRAAIFLMTAGDGQIQCAASRQLTAGYIKAIEDYYSTHALGPLVGDYPFLYIENASEKTLVEELRAAALAEGLGTMLFLPMRQGHELFGMFVLYHNGVRRYQAAETDLARTFADQAAVAIRHARLFDAERRARHQAGVVLEATRDVTSSLQLTEVLTRTAAAVAAAFRQRFCGIWLMSEDETTMAPIAGVGGQPGSVLDDMFFRQPAIPLAQSPNLMRMIATRQPVIVDDTTVLTGTSRDIQQMLGYQAFVDVPMVARDKVVGVAAVPIIGGRLPDQDDLAVAMAICRSAALAVENARLYEQAQRLAVSEERNRLARELHDSVTQSLFSMTLISQALPRILDRDVERARERIDRLNELGRGALAEMRALIFQLRPAALEDEGLVAALRKHVAAFEARERLAVTLTITGDRRLPLTMEEAVFRVGQEALHNVAKHAAARSVQVALTLADAQVELIVADDGRGLPDDAPARADGARTLGMTSMRERASLAGGTLLVESAPGAGTRVLLRIPLAQD